MIIRNNQIQPIIFNSLIKKINNNSIQNIYPVLKLYEILIKYLSEVISDEQFNYSLYKIDLLLDVEANTDSLLQFLLGLVKFFIFKDQECLDILKGVDRKDLDDDLKLILDFIISLSEDRLGTRPTNKLTSILFSRSFHDYSAHKSETNTISSLHGTDVTFSHSQNINLNRSLIAEMNCFENFFLVGHGDYKRGFKYYSKYNKGEFLYADYFKLPLRKLKVFGIFSCAVDPYLDITNISEYFIIPNSTDTNFQAYERFLYGFSIIEDKISLNRIKIGIIAILLKANSPIPFSVYFNGKPSSIFA